MQLVLRILLAGTLLSATAACAKPTPAAGPTTSDGLLAAKRVTFLLTPDGKVQKVYRDVDPGLHARQILADVQATPGS